VTAPFVTAIAADGKVGLVGESGEQVKGPALLGVGHLGAVSAHEDLPFPLGLGTPAQLQRLGTWCQVGNAVYEDMLRAIPKGASSPEAQACVERWRLHGEYFWNPNDEQLLGLVDGYNNDPRFKANFDNIHPDLAEFIREAVIVHVKGRKKQEYRLILLRLRG